MSENKEGLLLLDGKKKRNLAPSLSDASCPGKRQGKKKLDLLDLGIEATPSAAPEENWFEKRREHSPICKKDT